MPLCLSQEKKLALICTCDSSISNTRKWLLNERLKCLSPSSRVQFRLGDPLVT